MTTTSGQRQRAGLLILAMVVIVCSLTGFARANPAVDEYRDRFPSAGGKNHGDAGTPTGNPLALPPAVVAKLAKDPDGKALAAIGTASSLGAPVLHPGDTGSGGSFLRALLDPVVLLLAAAMAVIVLTMRRARRRDAS